MRLIPKTPRGRLGIALAVLFLLIVAAIVYDVIWGWPGTTPTSIPRPPVAATPETIAPNNVDRTRTLFGPWELAAPGSTGAPALVMLRHDGGLDVSSWSVPVDDSWRQTDPSLISALTPGDQQVTLSTSDHHTFVLAYGQPFVFESQPGYVFAINRNSDNSYTIVTTTTDQAHRLGHSISR